jgi:hypothetical protein
MGAPMGEAVTPTVPETGRDPDLPPTLRERLGIATFVVLAVVATVAWISLLAWGLVKLANGI